MALAQVPVVPVVPPLYDVVTSAAFNASSLPVPWASGKYRRLEIVLRVDSGTASGYLTFQGLSGETYSRTGWYANPSAVFTNFAGGPSGTAWVAQGIGNQIADVNIDVSCAAASEKTFRARIADMGGYQASVVGTCSDTTNPVSGVTVTFGGATAGWLEVLGYP